MSKTVLVHLGTDEGGIPFDIMVGAPGCERVSVVGAPDIAAAIARIAGPEYVIETDVPTLDAARCPVHICGPLARPADMARALRLALPQVTDLPTDLHWLSAGGNLFGFRPEVG